MATVVNNPAPTTTNDNSGMGFLLGVILLIAFVLLVLFYGLPYLRNSFSGAGINVPSSGTYNVNVHTSGNGGGAPAGK